jgi:serine/threonine-protein kinase HipA
MRRAAVYIKGSIAGYLTEENRNSYSFRYDNDYFNDNSTQPVSVTLPKNNQEYKSNHLFPFFFNMLSEGANRKLQSKLLKIDKEDHFGILLATAEFDTIGCVTVRRID